jgi:hypothetical protein
VSMSLSLQRLGSLVFSEKSSPILKLPSEMDDWLKSWVRSGLVESFKLRVSSVNFQPLERLTATSSLPVWIELRLEGSRSKLNSLALSILNHQDYPTPSLLSDTPPTT